MSLLQELTKRVMNDDAVTSRDSIGAHLFAASAKLKRTLEIGACDLIGLRYIVGVDPDQITGAPPYRHGLQCLSWSRLPYLCPMPM